MDSGLQLISSILPEARSALPDILRKLIYIPKSVPSFTKYVFPSIRMASVATDFAFDEKAKVTCMVFRIVLN
jgi:hypothetical protein